MVRAIDTLKRPVLRNRRFTVRWAEEALAKYRRDPLQFISPNPLESPNEASF